MSVLGEFAEFGADESKLGFECDWLEFLWGQTALEIGQDWSDLV